MSNHQTTKQNFGNNFNLKKGTKDALKLVTKMLFKNFGSSNNRYELLLGLNY